MRSDVFETDSFQLAAFLLSKSCRLIRLDKTNPRRAMFIFEEGPERRELTSLFLAHEAEVEPHRYFSAQKDLKQMLYQSE